MLTRIKTDFQQYYLSLEKLLNEACMRANKESNADVLQAIADLHETAKFIKVDLDEFEDVLFDINKYMSLPENNEDEELN